MNSRKVSTFSLSAYYRILRKIFLQILIKQRKIFKIIFKTLLFSLDLHTLHSNIRTIYIFLLRLVVIPHLEETRVPPDPLYTQDKRLNLRWPNLNGLHAISLFLAHLCRRPQLIIIKNRRREPASLQLLQLILVIDQWILRRFLPGRRVQWRIRHLLRPHRSR